MVTLTQKEVDTAVSTQVFNNDGVTKNTVSANQSVGSGSTVTMSMNMVQSANYKHIGCHDKRFAVYVNATNQSDWDASQWAVTFDGVPCAPLGTVAGVSQAAPASVVGSVVYSAICSGDFAPIDGATHKLGFRIQAQSGVNPGPQNVSINFMPVEYYLNTISGAVATGAVKNDGAAIQAVQSVLVYLY
jgi:hypothetical protein